MAFPSQDLAWCGWSLSRCSALIWLKTNQPKKKPSCLSALPAPVHLLWAMFIMAGQPMQQGSVFLCQFIEQHVRHSNPWCFLRAKCICKVAPTLIFQTIFLYTVRKIPFCPQLWQKEVRTDQSEIHNSHYCHRRGSIPYLINHMQDPARKVWYRWQLGSLGKLFPFKKRNIIVVSVSNF